MSTRAIEFNPRRIERARLSAGMTHSDLAFGIRRVSEGALRPNEQSIRRWIQGKHTPGADVVAAIAAATEKDIAYFYEPDADDEEDDAGLLRDLQAQLPPDHFARVERALERRAVAAG